VKRRLTPAAQGRIKSETARRWKRQSGPLNRQRVSVADDLSQILSSSHLPDRRPYRCHRHPLEARMSAELVSISEAPDPPAHMKRLNDAQLEAEEAMCAALSQVGLLDRAHISPGADPNLLSPIHRVLVRVWHARVDVQSSLERRIRQLERTLRGTFASDALNDEQRAMILSTLHGCRRPRRNSKILSETEASMIAEYRAMDGAGKQMLRTLFNRLAQANRAAEEQGGAR